MLKTMGSRAFIAGLICFILTLNFSSCSPRSSENHSSQQHLDTLLRRGIAFTQKLQFDSALNDLNQVLSIAASENNTHMEALAHINLGGLYFRYNADEKAMEHFLDALDLATNAGEDELLNTIYNNLGIIYSDNNSSQEALHYLNMALKISREKNAKSRVAMNLINIGNEYHFSRNLEKASEAYIEAQDIFQQLQDTINWGIAIQSLGGIMYERGNYEAAREKYLRAFGLLQPTDAVFYEAQVALSLGKTYYQFQEYDTATKYIMAALPGFITTKSAEYAQEAYQWLSKINRDQKNHDLALEYLQASLNWKDSLIQQKTGRWASEIQMTHEFQQKQKEIEILQAEAKSQRMVWSLIIIASTLLGALLIYILRVKNINLRQKNKLLETEMQVDRLTLEKKESERAKLAKEIEAASKLNQLERKKLEQELEYKERVLAAQTLHMVTKNETLADVLAMLDNLQESNARAIEAQVETMRRKIKATKRSDQDWKTFKLHFEDVHPGFFHGLSAEYPHLLSNDLRMCAYLVLDLNTKEIAHVFNITPESVRKRKQRLKEKLALDAGHDLTQFLRNFRIGKTVKTKEVAHSLRV